MTVARQHGGGSGGNFEFDALRWANNYRKALLSEFAPYLSGDVIEVGAGIGQFTELLAGLGSIRSVLAIDLDPGINCDTIVSTNVLEHIEHDAAELRLYAALLKARRGHLCLFVPARSELY